MLESSNTNFQFFFEEMSIFVVVSVTYLFYICLCHPVLLIVVCVCVQLCVSVFVCVTYCLTHSTPKMQALCLLKMSSFIFLCGIHRA